MKQVYKIGNSDELNSSQAVLLIEVGETHCCFAIVDYANFMMVQSCYYSSEENDKGDILKIVIEEHAELRQSFRQTVVGYYTAENILVPSKFYRHEEIQTLLQSMYGKGQNVVVSESIAEWQLNNVYYVLAATHGLLSRRFATGNFWHTYSMILKNTFQQKEGGNFMVDFKLNSFSLVAVKNNSLQLAQIFSYSKAADVLYWLLKTCREFSFSQNEVKLTLSGLIDKQSSVFKELYQYFIDIEFAPAENDIQLSRDFEDHPIHFFSSLYKLAACVS
jgi:hypothetical protein